MIILGIETSCDETAAAIVEDGTKILSSAVASSEQIHKKYGGIVPEQAAREQLKSMIPVLQEALEMSNVKCQMSKPHLKSKNCQYNIDAIAVTIGPGLIGSLLVGVETAKTLAWLWNKPIVSVNHLIAHIYGNFIEQHATCNKQQEKNHDACNLTHVALPSLCLIVSGGHTELVLMKGHGQFQWIGGTRDDASGECFDKCARLLGLGYPGGPAIAAAATKLKAKSLKLKANIKLPRPMMNQNNFDFSFSGIKTAVLNIFKKTQSTNSLITNQLAYEIQEAITDVLVAKTLKAAEKYRTKSILIGGGVAANSRLREKFELNAKSQKLKAKIFFPKKIFCTDNAATVAAAAYFNYRPIPWQKIKANPGLEITDKIC